MNLEKLDNEFEFKDLIKDAFEKFGQKRQLRKLQEECCELAMIISHFLDENKKLHPTIKQNSLINEIADVIICIEYAKLSVPIDKIKERIQYKMKYLKKLLS